MTNNTREKRVEDMLVFILKIKGWWQDYLDIKESFTYEKIEDSSFTDKQSLELKKYHRLARTEDKLDFLMKSEGIQAEYLEHRKKQDLIEKRRRRDLALASEDNSQLKKLARIHYANMSYLQGEPVFYEGKWVYIDAPEIWNKD